MFPVTRMLTVAMAGVVCFALLIPLALSRHNAALATFLIAIFAAYAIANVVLWIRLKRRA
ncbi:MAG: hypothetical protein WCD38_03985 [Candidatus Tumulicola sp.]